MKAQDRQIIIATLFVIAATFIIGFNFIYSPKIRNIAKLKQELQKTKSMEGILFQIKSLRQSLNSYEKNLLDSDDVSYFLNEITNMAKESQINLTSVTPQSAKEYDNFKRLILKIGIRSNYHRLGRFVSLLESSQIYIRIDECHLRVRQQPFSRGSISVEKYAQGDTVADIEMIVSAIVEK